jgi:hypothetical protein
MRITTLFVAFLFFVGACNPSNKVPNGILPPKKMEAVLWDLLRSGNLVNNFILSKDSSLDKNQEHIKWINRVLTFHRVSEAEFKKSFAYYQQHPELMSVIMDSISKREDDPVIRLKPRQNYRAE